MPETYIDPTRESFDAFKALPRDTPINMLNLLRFRDVAAYPDGHGLADKGITGRAAYAEYGCTSGPIFERLGGRIVWRGTMESIVTGPQDETWDMAFIASYPHSGAFLAMVTDPDYQIAVINRQAAVADSRLVRYAPGDGDPLRFG
jgi:uncharacterized protein (DUF1330 family)